MAKRSANSSSTPPEFCFVTELAGENPPAFSAMKKLYESAARLLAMRPWEFMADGDPIMVRDSVSGELCYCSVMGALGEVYSVHGYIGAQSFRLYRAIAEERLTDPVEFLSNLRSVNVEFVSRKDLERQDRELLAWLGHPTTRGLACPVFRANRPGCHPWFVTAEEAQTLDECMRATIAVVNAILLRKGDTDFWSREDHYPLVTLSAGGESRIELIKSVPPAEPPLPPARLDEEASRKLHAQDYTIGGAMELDYVQTGAPVGKKNERKVCICIGLGVDARTGFLYPPQLNEGGGSPGDSLAKVFASAVQATRTVPSQVTVRTERLQQSLAPLLESFGVKVRVAAKLPAADDARSHLLGFLTGGLEV